MKFTPYDPNWIVELAAKQRPDLPWMPDSISKCTQCHKKLRSRKKECIYIHFVDPKDANQPGADWQYRETISLDHPLFGHLKLDVLQDNRIGGIEFYDRL